MNERTVHEGDYIAGDNEQVKDLDIRGDLLVRGENVRVVNCRIRGREQETEES